MSSFLDSSLRLIAVGTGDTRHGDAVTGKTRIPVTADMRRDLREAIEVGHSVSRIVYVNNGRVSKQTVYKILNEPSKRSVTWEQWVMIATVVGLDPAAYLPESMPAPPEWNMPERLRVAVHSIEDRRLIERALERLLVLGREERNQFVHVTGDANEEGRPNLIDFVVRRDDLPSVIVELKGSHRTHGYHDEVEVHEEDLRDAFEHALSEMFHHADTDTDAHGDADEDAGEEQD